MRSGGRRARRQWAAVGVVALVVALAAAALTVSRGGPAGASTLRYVSASLGTVTQTVSATGTIEPAQQAAVNFAVSGQVSTVAVHLGEHVNAGQPLARVSSTTLAAQLAAAQAAVNADQTRAAADVAGGASAVQATADQAQLTAAQSQLAGAQTALADATLAAPFAGTVAAINLVPGQQVAGSGSATAEVTVITAHRFLVDAAVIDTQVGALAAGDRAVVVPDGGSARAAGVVSSVALVATQASGVASYPVVVSISGDPTGLYPGAGAQVSFLVRRLAGVLTVPTDALMAVGGQPAVRVEHAGGPVTRRVSVGASGGGRTQITAGLAAGEKVAISGAPGGTGTAGRPNQPRKLGKTGRSGKLGQRAGGGGFGGLGG